MCIDFLCLIMYTDVFKLRTFNCLSKNDMIIFKRNNYFLIEHRSCSIIENTVKGRQSV